MKESTNIETDSDVSLEIPPGTVVAYSIRELKIRKNGEFGEHWAFFFSFLITEIKGAALILKGFALNVESGDCFQQTCQAKIVCPRVFICDTAFADIGVQPGTTGGIECDSLADSLTAVDGSCQEELLSLDVLLKGLFPLFSTSWPSSLVLGSETQRRSEKTSIFF